MSTTTTPDLEVLKYPIGKFPRGTKADTPERRAARIALIEAFPHRLSAEVESMSDAQLDTPYRSGGWTVRQLVHHIADSHSQAIARFKLALTEDKPTIKPYKEALWAEQADARTMPVEPSLAIVGGVHARWVVLLKSMSAADFDRTFFHPEQQREVALSEALELYAWHSDHHLAHITGLRSREQW